MTADNFRNRSIARILLKLIMSMILMAFTTGFSSLQQDLQLERISVILILDNSGSMKDSDPSGLRFTGARLFVSLLDTGDSVGLIVFSTGSQALSDGLVIIGDENQKCSLLSSLASQAPKGYTDIKAALEQAASMAARYSPAILLLTDGKPEMPDPYPTYEQETLALARSLGVPVMGIALTHAARTPFLDQLAAETGGNVIPADNAGDLLDAYLAVLGQIKDRTVIGEGSTNAPGKADLFLDPGLAPFIEKVSFLVGKPAGVNASLIAPDGKLVTPNDPGVLFSVTDDPDFMVMTVAHPQGGNWSVRLEGSGPGLVRAILHSRLRVEIESPSSYHEAEAELPVIVRLLEEDQADQKTKIIGEASFSALITLPDGSQESLDRFYDDGTHGDKVAGDGEYTRLYVNTGQVGQFLLQVEGRKGAVPVEASARFETIPFPALVVDKPANSQTIQDIPISLAVHLEGGEKATLDSGQIIARILSPAGEEQSISLTEKGASYLGSFSPQEEGTYTVFFESQSATYFGLPYQHGTQISFEVDIPKVLRVDPVQSQPLGCFDRDVQLSVPLHLSSMRQEEVEIRVEDLENFQTTPQSIVLEQGLSEISIVLIQKRFLFWGRDFEGRLVVNAPTELEVLPGTRVSFHLIMPSLFSRCSRVIGWGVGTTVLVILVAMVALRRARAATLPPLVTGTLRFGLADLGKGEMRELDLTALKRAQVVIGSSEGCDLSIPELAPRHAILRAIKTEQGEKVVLEPVDEIRKGYGLLHAGHILEHSDTVRMGAYEFQYLSDTGV